MPAAPSLLIVPYRSKTGKLYSQIPTSGAGDFTITRNTEARRFNSAGLIASVASGIPRLDYYTSGGTAGCPALLVEPAATNLAFQSENFLTTWVLLSGTISTGTTAAFTAPDGTTNADLFTESTDVSATNHQLSQSISTAVVSGTSYTLSCFFKATAANRSARLSLSSALFSGSPQAFFDVTSGVVGTTTDCTARIENYGSGWYRCIMTAICDVAGTASVFVSSASGNTRDYIGNGSAALSIWGAQLETGSVATSYIPTTAGQGSRSADVVSVSGAVSGSIGQTAGTIYCEFTFLGTPTARSGPIFLRQAASRGMGINFSTSDSPTGISFISRNDGGSTVLTVVSGALQLGTFYKVAIGYDAAGTAAGGSQASGVVAYVNGVQTAIGTLRVPDAAGLTEFRMYAAPAGSDTEAFNGRIRSAALYTTRLTDAELAALTSP